MSRSRRNFYTWRELSYADSRSTGAAIDTFQVKTRKIPDSLCCRNERALSLSDAMIADYLKAFDFVEFRPLSTNYYRDQKSDFVSFGVFAKEHLPLGFKIPGVIGYLSILNKSEIIQNVNDFSVVWDKKASKLMLGSLSFVNSSCSPNCQYVPRLKLNLMEIAVTAKRGISPGQEVTVFYGGDYFGENRVGCQCPFIEYHGSNVRIFDSWTRSGRQRTLLCNSSPERLEVTCSSLVADSRPRANGAVRSKRRKLSTKFIKARASTKGRRFRKSRLCSSSESYGSSEESDEADVIDQIPETDSCTNARELCSEHQFSSANTEINCLNEVTEQDFVFSTPKHIQFCENFEEFSAEPENDNSDSSSSSFENSSSSDELCNGSRISVNTFSNRFLELMASNCLTDRSARSILQLFQDSLPHSNNVPSFHFIQSFTNQHKDQIQKVEINEGVAFYFDIQRQIEHVLTQNYDVLAGNNSWFPSNDILLPKSNDKVVYLIMNVDGVSPCKSTKFELYPIWLLIANFPASRRVKFKNMVLGGLYGGTKKPCFEKFFEPFCKSFKLLQNGFKLMIGREEHTVSSYFLEIFC